MAEEKKKPDYTDMDWSWLIRDREEKWKVLLQQAEADHWPIIPLRKTEKFTSQLILLPIQEEEDPENKKKDYYEKRVRTVAEAKAGSEKAMETLTLQDMDLYAMLQRRVQQEDILSIVESYFMPYGMESDQYRMLGTIQNVRTERNKLSKEEIVILTVLCNGMQFDVCINRADLGGEPEVGRRFKGTVWLQGRVNFTVRNTARSAFSG